MLENLKNEFLYPKDEYTPIPFWFWNDDLTEKEIIRQINDFNDKGVNGFVIHPRIGIPKEIEYLSDRFMELVKCAVIEADKLNMKVVLYDEAMYPSGSAHGMVVEKNPEYASKALKMTEYKCSRNIKIDLASLEKDRLVSASAVKKAQGSENEIEPDSVTKINVVNNEISFESPDEGDWSVLLFTETFTNGHIRGIHFGEDDGEENPPASSDLLNKEAMKAFIELTHERYYEVLKEFFGNTIIGMFTDEPCIMGRGHEKDLKPWTSNFLDYYLEQGNSESDLPFLWFDAGKTSRIKRKRYDETVNRKMEETYYRPIYEWCSEHNIALTGHPEKSEDIGFLKYFHIPAQDLVFRWVAPEDGLALEGMNSTMAKCTSDSARHRGMRRNGNECFACCGKNGIEWSFTADDMKWLMDWLFVRGVNLLFPHAFYYSVDGPKRIGERPPDVGPNNIWWDNYNQISDYIKRMSYIMTDSVNRAQVAVLSGQSYLPWQIVRPLYENQIEFNYLENELFISEACKIEASELKIAQQAYRVLIIEDIELIDNENLGKLQEFIDNGGTVIIFDPENKELSLSNNKQISSFDEIVGEIDQVTDRDVLTTSAEKDLRASHINKDDSELYVFVNEGEEKINTTVRLNTVGSVEKWDAWKGVAENAEIVREVRDGHMYIDLSIDRRESLILIVDSNELPKVTPTVSENYATENIEQQNIEINKIGQENISQENNRQEIIELNNGWYMGTSLENLEKADVLTPWNEISGLEHFSGSMIYKNNFNINKPEINKRVQLDLGEVHEIAFVSLNGTELAPQMWSPYIFEISDHIRDGENVLIVEVKNTLANRICKISLKSGMVGPISLKLYE